MIDSVPMMNGRGEVGLPFGFTFPKTGGVQGRPRLVVNEGTPDELVSAPKVLRLEQPEVNLVWGDKDIDPDLRIDPKYEGVTADYPQIPVEVVSAEWFRRFDDLSEGDRGVLQRVDWETLSAPAATTAGLTLAEDGFFETALETGTTAGLERQVRARIGDVLLGATDPVVVEPGRASEVTSMLTIERVSMPADGATTALVTVEARDQHGNLVADGTAVLWEQAEDTDGTFIEAQEATQNGRATAKYRAGFSAGLKTLRAQLDDVVFEDHIEQAVIGLIMVAPAHKFFNDRTSVEITVHATSGAGPVSDDAEIGWFTTIGRMEQIQPLTDGEAKALWRFGGISNRPRVQFIATLGRGRAQRELEWEQRGFVVVSAESSNGMRMADRSLGGGTPGGAPADPEIIPFRATDVEPLMMAGDIAEDGFVPIERPDGTLEPVFVKASGTYRASGLVPGEPGTVTLGTNRAPNLPPIAHYTGEAILEGLVPDATGVHDGLATSGVTQAGPGYQGQAFTFDGGGVLTVPHDPEFEFSQGFMVQTAVRPPPGGTGILIEKVGQFRLELVPVADQIRARFTIQTAEGETQLISLDPVPVGEWSVLTGRFESSRIWIGIDTESSRSNDFAFLSSLPIHSAAEIQIGPGYTGELDEIRLYDLTATPLSTFPGGLTSISFVADADGNFEMPILPTGQLGPGSRVALYYGTLAAESLRLAADEPPPTNLQISAHVLIEAETFWEDVGERSTTWYGYTGAVLMGSMVKFTRGVLVGSEPGDLDLAVLAGDITGSIFLAPAAILRDMANATQRLVDAQPSGDDALSLAFGLIAIAGALTKGKLGAFLKIGKLAEALPAGSRASRTVARVIALEAKLAAGAAGASKVQKLILVAQLSSAASQMVGAVLDAVGVNIEALEAFNNMMSNLPEDQDPEEVLQELSSIPHDPDLSADDLLDIVLATGTPLAEDAPAAAATPVPRQFVRFTRKLLRGVTVGKKWFKNIDEIKSHPEFGAYTKTLARRIKHHHQGSFQEIWEKLDDITLKMARESPATAQRINGNIHRLLRDLGSKQATTRRAALLVLRTAHSLPRSGMILERYQRVVTAAGKRIRRFPDITVGDFWVECKAWARWGVFPPADGTLLRKFVAGAERQLLVAIYAKGLGARSQYLMVFSADGIGSCCGPDVVRHFRDFLLKPETIAKVARERAISKAAATVLLRQIRAGISTMIDFQ